MITTCILTFNEGKKISTCIDSIKGCVDEIMVVDGFSTDNTIEIAKGKGAIVYQREMNKDFGKQRNYAIEKAKSDWIFMLDADEICSPILAQKLKQLSQHTEYDGFSFLWKNYCNDNLVETVRKLCLFKRIGYYEDEVHEKVLGLDKIANLQNEDCFIIHNKTKDDQKKHFLVYKEIIEQNLAKSEANKDFKKMAYYEYAKKRQSEKESIWLDDYITI